MTCEEIKELHGDGPKYQQCLEASKVKENFSIDNQLGLTKDIDLDEARANAPKPKKEKKKDDSWKNIASIGSNPLQESTLAKMRKNNLSNQNAEIFEDYIKYDTPIVDKFDDLNSDAKQKYNDLALKRLQKQYKDTDNYEITEEEVNQNSLQIFDDVKNHRLTDEILRKDKDAELELIDELSAFDNIKNNLFNAGQDVERVAEFWGGGSLGLESNAALDLATASIYQSLFGKENVDAFVKKNGAESWLTKGLGADAQLKALELRKSQKDEKKATLPIIESFKQGEILKGVSAIAGSITNVVGSLAYGAGTAFTGYFIDFYSDNYVEYNTGLAKRKGMTLSELILADEAEIKKPLGIAAVQSAAELIQVGRLTKALPPKFRKKIFDKATNSQYGAMTADLIGTGSTGFVTEVFQSAAEEANKTLGATGDSAKAADTFIDFVFSQDGLETGVQGALGEGGARGSRYVKRAINNVRAGVDVKGIENDFSELGDLQKQFDASTDAVVKEGIQSKINEVDARLKTRITKSNSIVSRLTPENIAEVNTMGALAELQVKRVGELNALKKDNKVSQKDYLTALEGFKSTYLDAKNRIKGIADTVKTESEVEVSQKNQIIADVNTENMSIIKESDNTAKVEAAKNKIVENNQGIINQVINSNFDPTIRDGISLADFKAEVNLEVSELIKTWKSGSAPFGAYLKTNLPLRIPGIFDRNIETKEDGGFVAKTDITEQVDITDDAVTVEETIDNKDAVKNETETAADKLREITGITKEETIEAGTKIIGEKIRVEPVKGAAQPAKRDVSQSGKLKFSTKVIDAMGGKLGVKNNKIGNYITFLESNGADIVSLVNAEPEIKNTVLREVYKPKKIGRTTGKFDKGAGKGVFEYQNENPTAQDLVDWATDPTKGLTTLINRQATLADVLSGLLGRASTLETVATPEGKATFQTKQELQGKKLKPDTIDRLISDIDVSLRNFDGILLMGISPKMIGDALKGGLRIFDRAIKAGNTIQQAISKAVKKINSIIKNADIASVVGRFFTEAFTTIKNQGKAIKKATNDVLVWAAASTGKIDTVLRLSGINGIYNLKIPADRIAYKKILREKIFPLMPRAFWNNKKMFTEFPAKTGTKEFNLSNKEISDILDSMDDSEFGDRVIGVTSYVRKKYSDVFGVTGESTLQALNDAAGIEFNKNNMLIHEELWKRINKVLVDSNGKIDKNTARGIGNWLKGVGNDTTHWHKIGAEVLGADPNSVSLHWEHAMPATAAYIYLINSILNPNANFQSTYELVKANYKVIAIDTKDNKKIDKAGLTRNMPEWWTVMDNWYDRYFNKQVAAINGGIDINTIVMANGVSIGKKFNINSPEGNPKQSIIEAKIKANTVIEKGKDYIKNNPDAIPIAADPVVLDKDINKIIEDTKGIKARFRYSDIVAKRKGAGVRSFKIIPAGAQDFSGLMYDLYGKGKKGEIQQKWVKDNLIKPYQNGVAKIDKYRQALKNDYSALLKKFPEVSGKLGSIIPGTEFTFDQALRVNLWTQGGFEIPGLSKRDIKKLNDIVEADPKLKLFNESALAITKQPKWVSPSPHWDVESLISDLNSLTTKVGRKEYLAEFIANKNVIFSKENLNKMEVALGTNWREAMEDSLYRMENGTNRPSGSNKLTNDFLNWVNNSVGAIMFLNVKSALLQTISSVNFLNWSDNNPFKAGLALANFPQYVKDFSFLWNSPKLIQRRSGLRKDINEAELANAAQGSKNKPAVMLSYLLKLGFTPTQLADSFAIASGGATFYRNRLNTYKKQGLSEAEASDKAFEDFAEASDVAQQSADPMLISQQQASVLGRLLLAFQNTPAQVTRIFNKASRDFINNRGDQKTNISKMMYYGAIQGFIFAALQNAAFALIPGFDEEEDKEKKAREFDKKEERILNSMVDTMLRGSGVYGAIVATLKNTALTYYREEKKDAFGRDHRNTLLEIMNLSPPVGSKIRKINNAIKAKDYNKEVVKEQGWDVTLKGKVNLSPSYQVIASLTEAITNLPLERAVVEIGRVVEVLDARNTTFQRVALALGYRTWDVNVKNEERDLVKIESKEAKEKARKQKVIDDRAERKRLKEVEKYKGKTEDEIKQMKRRDSIVDTNKSAQMKSLINLGLTKKQIKELKYEDDRVNKIIELTNK